MGWFNRFSNLFRREHLGEELDEELQFHLDARTQDNLDAGMNAGAARDDARRRFGNATLAKEHAHEMNIILSFEAIGRDLHYAFRNLRKAPGFTAVALLTLALGVGANTAVFSLINGLLLRPLPVPHAEQLAVLRDVEGAADSVDYEFCAPFFRGLENRHQAFSQVFAYNDDVLQVKGQSGNENISGMLVSGQFFEAMETAPLIGRYLTPEDDQPGGSTAGLAVVISEDYWSNHFNRAAGCGGPHHGDRKHPFHGSGSNAKALYRAGPDIETGNIRATVG